MFSVTPSWFILMPYKVRNKQKLILSLLMNLIKYSALLKLNTLRSLRQFLESFFRANSDIQAKFQNPTTTPSGSRPVQRWLLKSNQRSNWISRLKFEPNQSSNQKLGNLWNNLGSIIVTNIYKLRERKWVSNWIFKLLADP